MERIPGILRRFHRSTEVDAPQAAAADKESRGPLTYVRGWDDLMQLRVDPDPVEKPFDEKKVLEEAEVFAHRIDIAAEKYGSSPIGVKPKDYEKWKALEQTFARDIDSIQLIYTKDLHEVGQVGADSWLIVAHTHAMALGAEIVARRNIQQRLALARKNGVEDRIGPYLQLVEFRQGLMTSIKVGEITFQDFLYPKENTLVGRFRFLTQARLAVHRSLYDEILQDNMEPPKNDLPNIIKSTIWVLPTRVQALLSLTPDAFEHAYKNSKYPLNEMGMSAARLVRGAQETRSGVYRLLLNPLNPYSKHLEALKQVMTDYFFENDRAGLFLVLIHLGLHTTANTRHLYRQARRYTQTGVEVEFFTRLGNIIRDYAKESSVVGSLPSEDDMDLVADLDESIDPTKIPSFEQLGLTLSGIFPKSSQTAYTVDPDRIDWPLSKARSITVQFDKNRPKKFDVTLVFTSEDGEEITEVAYSVDATRKTMDWEYVVDPMLPENNRIANFRSLLLISTQAILGEIQRLAEEQYQAKIAARTASVTPTKGARRERFEDPIYALRKEVKAEQRQAQEEAASETTISVDEMIESANIKNEIEVPDDMELKKLLQYLSPEDAKIAVRKIQEYNEVGTSLELTKKKRLGPDGQERWTGRFACNVPKGGRILMAPAKFVKGLRRFEIIDVRYRKDIYPRNKI